MKQVQEAFEGARLAYSQNSITSLMIFKTTRPSFLTLFIMLAAFCLTSFKFTTTTVALDFNAIIPGHTKEIQFFKTLGHKESGGDYTVVNTLGYLGKYQFGEQALVALGYYEKDGSAKNDWKGNWTGKNGVVSKDTFLQNWFMQEIAVRELAEANWQAATSYGLHKFVGKKVNGVNITKTGILAGMHLTGPKSVVDFLKRGVESQDGFGTSVRKYMTEFAQV